MKMILALSLLFPLLSFASGTQKGKTCSINKETVLKIKPINDGDTYVEFFENGEATDILDCGFEVVSRKLEVTCSVAEGEGSKTVIKILAGRGKNKSSIVKTFITADSEEVIEDSKMTCKKL